MRSIREGITFDDVLLIPKRSRVFSRKDVSTKTQLTKNISFSIPLVSANMDTVTEARMAAAMARAGGIGIIHRFLSVDDQVAEVRAVKRTENVVIEDPLTAPKNTTLGELKKLMAKNHVSSVLITHTKNGKEYLEGIVTARDILFEHDDEKPAARIMTKKVYTAPPKTNLDRARAILHKHRIEKLPLVTKEGVLSGLITLRDIVQRETNPAASKDSRGRLLVGAAVGVKEDTLERARALCKAGADVLVIDIAHGHNNRATQTIKTLKKELGADAQIIAGNIATEQAAQDLIRAGADGLKVGIGPGAACTTRVVTGVGVPQLTAISDVARVAAKAGVPIIADGGIRTSGDFAKALAAGAQSAMVGNLLAGCSESPGEYIIDRGKAYKYYRGMASFEASSEKTQIDGGNKDGTFRSPEGASGRIPYRGDAHIVITDLLAGLRSSMSYLGARGIGEFQKNAEFIRISAASAIESGPHGVE